MYKKNCQFSVTPLDIQFNDRILGVKLDQHDAMPIYAFSVYMPSVNYSTDDYQECFACLQNLYETFCAHGIVLFLGDFKCDIYKAKAGDDRLRSFVSFPEMTYMTAVPLEGYCTFRHTCKTLDYVLQNKHQHYLIISNTAVDKGVCMVSDHLPIFTLLKSEVVTYSIPQCCHVAWNKCTEENLASYQSVLEDELSKLEAPINCTIADVNLFYEAIAAAIHKAAKLTLPKGLYNQHAKPYWTAEVKHAHRNQRIEWVKQGRPRGRDNAYYRSYKEAKSKFRKIQKEAISAVEFKYYSELEESAECDIRLFWQLVNKRRKTKSSTVCKLVTDEKVSNDPKEISTIFADHFSSLYIPKDHVNYDGNCKLEIENKRKLFDTNEENNSDLLTCAVELSELKVCLKDLKKRKSPGADNISNEHLIHGGPALLQSLQKLYCKMIELEVIPDKCKVGIIIPIHKPGKCRDSPDSYTPVTLVSSIYKFFERVFLTRLQGWAVAENKTFSNLQQNAYQKYLGSLTVSFNLQETVANNTELN